MERVKVIYHMTVSIDGKITGDYLSDERSQEAISYYYAKHREFKSDGFICGRKTMASSFGHLMDEKAVLPEIPIESNEDFVGDPQARFYAIALDSKGKLNWSSNTLRDDDPGYDGAHIIEVVCEDVDRHYLGYLQERRVSYVFAGKAKVDLDLLFIKLKDLFCINLLLLEGGGIIGGSFLQAGLVDELSLVVAPLIQGSQGQDLAVADKELTAHFTAQTPVMNESGVLYLSFVKTFQACHDKHDVIGQRTRSFVLDFFVMCKSIDSFLFQNMEKNFI